MTKRKWILPVCITIGVLLFLFIAFVAFAGIMTAKGYGISVGNFLPSSNGSTLIVVDNSPIRMSNLSDNEDLFSKCSTGDKLLVVHSGIAESYPAQSGAYFILKLGEGDITDINDEVIEELTELGWLEEPVFFDYDTYMFHDSPDVMNPTILLSRSDDKFQFTYSVLSNYAGIGRYERTASELTLYTDDGVNVWIFDVTEDGFVFDAESSSRIPSYKYSGDSDEASCPVPDGALFTKTSAKPIID